MILYNVTVNIDHSCKEEWVSWMNNTHIPEVMATGCFEECRFTRVMAKDDGGETYSLQYLAPDMDSYVSYQNDHSPALRADFDKRYAGKYASFRTILEVVSRHGKS